MMNSQLTLQKVLNIKIVRMAALIMGLTAVELALAEPTVLRYSFNAYLIDFGDVEVDSYRASALGYDCQRQQSATQTISFDLDVVQGANPDYPINYDPLINGRVNHQEFIIPQLEHLRLGNNPISLFFTPALLGPRQAQLTLNIEYDNVMLGAQPVKVILMGRGVCPGYDSDGNMIPDYQETESRLAYPRDYKGGSVVSQTILKNYTKNKGTIIRKRSTPR